MAAWTNVNVIRSGFRSLLNSVHIYVSGGRSYSRKGITSNCTVFVCCRSS